MAHQNFRIFFVKEDEPRENQELILEDNLPALLPGFLRYYQSSESARRALDLRRNIHHHLHHIQEYDFTLTLTPFSSSHLAVLALEFFISFVRS